MLANWFTPPTGGTSSSPTSTPPSSPTRPPANPTRPPSPANPLATAAPAPLASPSSSAASPLLPSTPLAAAPLTAEQLASLPHEHVVPSGRSVVRICNLRISPKVAPPAPLGGLLRKHAVSQVLFECSPWPLRPPRNPRSAGMRRNGTVLRSWLAGWLAQYCMPQVQDMFQGLFAATQQLQRRWGDGAASHPLASLDLGSVVAGDAGGWPGGGSDGGAVGKGAVVARVLTSHRLPDGDLAPSDTAA